MTGANGIAPDSSVPFAKLLSYKVMIIDNTGGNVFDFEGTGDQFTNDIAGRVQPYSSSGLVKFLLNRLSGGFFDDSDFSGTASPRGWIYASYEQ